MPRPALLLDLDGTLIDTAPDMVGTLNEMLAAEGRAPVTYQAARQRVSDGAVGLLQVGYGLAPEDPALVELRLRYLDHYERRLCVDSRIFNGFEKVIDAALKAGWAWGVVTNKPAYLAGPLLEALGLAATAGCLVGGDTLPRRKPHPDPLLHAAKLLGTEPGHCIYVGDAPRDIVAGRAAGMRTVAAGYGYLADPATAADWSADLVIGSPLELLALIGATGEVGERAG